MNDVLFTPWRMTYLTGPAPSEPSTCLFCDLQGLGDTEALIVLRGKHVFAVLNRYPYSNGHVMVAPFAHRGTLPELTQAERVELMDVAARLEETLRAEYSPHGLNAGLNLGRCAGAGVPGHLHLHLVPRWDGDTNFMTVLSGTRIVPEDLGVTYGRLRARLGTPEGGP
ncbi:MAG: HIT domain-containing protein [Holophagales bacterium]|nr:HIT domain-containing protein [Holophagales bacterium]